MDRKGFMLSLAGLGVGYSLSATSLVPESKRSKRIGIIGLDTTHAIAFTKAINEAVAGSTYSNFRVTTAFPYGSRTIPLSIDRIPKFTQEIQKYGVKMVESIAQLIREVDYVMLETNDGNLHLEQALTVIRARKPLFIDKPIANSYADALQIMETAKAYQCPVFSTSSLRYIGGLADMDKSKVRGADIYTPATTEPSHKDLFWYGIHGVEMLFALMGKDCLSVQTINGADADVYVGSWADGRVATLRGIRKGKDDFGGTVFLSDEIFTLGKFVGYAPLLDRILSFFETGISPVDAEETLAIASFIDAAYASKLQGGVSIKLVQR
ncbi:Gfo/Idh/MocA family protein [Sphingobacterium psychroaquaticum]|uniref:Oxidoreductase family, NAD-binding Rossmann fold n=1 Tax=Sphingobacterium psychroaquaticum TaxID=561061 RepID=A0A1X7JR97_9SPHI|nr:Gfo/Idh/MocA family oxidoreductase [Sphingobacterium psychroaquaticum]SMG30599.1 Oxidoreductase family, NAD-binding Rossmann fold [Sphingobacterium psychroaquaticum]